MTTPYTPKVAALLADIASNGHALSQNDAKDTTRRALLAAARSLTRELETPVESIARIAWAGVCLLVYLAQWIYDL